ncbi:CBS domain-containing protein [Nonomuraea sp. 3-1Str]|uniref:CBS domain-containing protein n=1 Tax=Nonomuraea sp. 3-1Str TaxID=2929801 RepID=UPI00285A62C9|nr:CBS domain-containing protein [Nonomuraea sp. 3-1Str]MDR8410311.1 CBS domain-containing protein [Nonomuraea sp. 3-1Str]
MLVRDIMSSPAVTVRRTASIRRAIRLLHGHDIAAAPVLDDAGRLVGLVSELDLLRGEFQPGPGTTADPSPAASAPPPGEVWQVMTHAVITVTETTDVTTAIDLLVGKQIKSLPVLAGQEVVGMVGCRDLMGVLARPDEELCEEVVAALRDHYPHGPFWAVTVRDGVAELRPAAGDVPDPGSDDALAAHVTDMLARAVPGVVRVRWLR